MAALIQSKQNTKYACSFAVRNIRYSTFFPSSFSIWRKYVGYIPLSIPFLSLVILHLIVVPCGAGLSKTIKESMIIILRLLTGEECIIYQRDGESRFSQQMANMILHRMTNAPILSIRTGLYCFNLLISWKFSTLI